MWVLFYNFSNPISINGMLIDKLALRIIGLPALLHYGTLFSLKINQTIQLIFCNISVSRCQGQGQHFEPSIYITQKE